MRPLATIRWPRSELAYCEAIGLTSNVAVVLRDLERGEYWLRVVLPDGTSHPLSEALVASHQIHGFGLTFDGSSLFWYNGDDLHAIALDGSWERTWRLEDGGIIRVFAPDTTQALVCRIARFPSVVAMDLESGTLTPVDVPHKPVTQMDPMLEVDPTWRRVAFGYVFEAVGTWTLEDTSFHSWPIEEIDPAVLESSPFIASLQFSQDAESLLVSSDANRRGGPASRARVGPVSGENVREFDTTPLRKRLTALPDLSVAFSTSWEASGQILALDLESGAIRETARVDFVPRDIVVTRDGRTCYVIDENGVVSFELDY
jgi:hypothetical protein